MGIFNKIRKAFRKGGALPHEHGPAVKLAKAKDAEAKCPVDHTKITKVKATANDNPACVCGQGSKCYCKAGDAKKKQDYAKAVVSKQKAASKAKPSKDAENKKAPAKSPAKKTPAKPATKAPAKKPAPKKK